MILTLVSEMSSFYANNRVKQHAVTNRTYTLKEVKRMFVMPKWTRNDPAEEYLYEFVTDQGYSWYIVKSKYRVEQTTEIPKKWLYRMLSK